MIYRRLENVKGQAGMGVCDNKRKSVQICTVYTYFGDFLGKMQCPLSRIEYRKCVVIYNTSML